MHVCILLVMYFNVDHFILLISQICILSFLHRYGSLSELFVYYYLVNVATIVMCA